MGLPERIAKIRERVGMNQAELAARVTGSYRSATASSWESGESTPTGEAMMAFVREFPWLDGHWLLTGEGEMERTDPTRAERLVRKFRELLDPIPDADVEPLDG